MKGVMGVVRKEGKLLLGIEAKESPIKGKWRFLGGRVRDDETPEAALERELLEESNVSIRIVQQLCQRTGDYLPIPIYVYLAEYVRGTPVPKRDEISELRYFSLAEIEELDIDNISKSVIDEYSHLF